MSQFVVAAWLADSQLAGFEAENAGDQRFSGASGDRWSSTSGAPPHWIRADLGTAKVATWYRVDPGRNGTDATNWTFQGSADGSTGWVTLDTQSAAGGRSTTTTYTFSNTTAYRYYRYHATTTVTGNHCSLAELEIGDGQPHAVVWEHAAFSSLSANATNGLVFVVGVPITVTHLAANVGLSTATWAVRIRDASGVILASATYAALSTESGWREIPITPVVLLPGTYMAEQYGGGIRASQRTGSHATAYVFGAVTIPQNGTVTFRGTTFTSRQSGGDTEPVGNLSVAEAGHGFRFELAPNVAQIAATPPAPVAAATADVVLPPTYTATIDASPPAPVAAATATVEAPAGPMEPGEHTVTVGGVDVSCLLDTVSIHHGRDDATGQPEASAVTMELTTDAAVDPLPPEVDVGAVVEVTTTTTTQTSVRFVGRVTDVALGWEDAGADTPDAGVGQIVAVGTLADLGRRVVGETPWPQELDGARVARIMAAAGVTLDPATSDPGTVDLLPRDVDSTAALSAAHDAATSAGGVLWATRDGDVRYADADHRRGVVSSLTLDACNLLVTPTWRRNLEGLVNEVSVGYGTAPEGGGDQPRFVETNPTSVARWGRYGYTATTALAELEDATTMGRLLLARNSEPVWIMAALPVDTLGLTTTEYDALLDLDVHALITLTGLPSLGTAPTTATLWVEGWRETLTYAGHDVELVVSGYCRSAPPPRWDDVDTAWTWDAGPPSDLTWDDVACLGPPVNMGRWNDQPANLRWDQIDPETTWDEYTNGG